MKTNTIRGDVNRLATTEEALRAKTTKGSTNFLKINDSSQRYIEVDTGMLRSRRYFLKHEQNVIPEVKSATNKALNPELHAQRPAPLRKSGRKNKEKAKSPKQLTVDDWMYYGRQYFTIHQVDDLIYTVGKLSRSKKFLSFSIVASIMIDEDVYVRESVITGYDLSEPLSAERRAESSIENFEPSGASARNGMVVGYELLATPKKQYREKEERLSFKSYFEKKNPKKTVRTNRRKG